MRYIHEVKEERIISRLTEVFKLYFSSSSLIIKLAVIPINRKTKILSKGYLIRRVMHTYLQ